MIKSISPWDSQSYMYTFPSSEENQQKKKQWKHSVLNIHEIILSFSNKIINLNELLLLKILICEWCYLLINFPKQYNVRGHRAVLC